MSGLSDILAQAKEDGCPQGPIELKVGGHHFLVKNHLTMGFDDGLTIALRNGMAASGSLLELTGARIIGAPDAAVVIIPGHDAALINRVMQDVKASNRQAPPESAGGA